MKLSTTLLPIVFMSVISAGCAGSSLADDPKKNGNVSQ